MGGPLKSCERLAVAALLAVLAAELGYGLRSDGLTIDELVYIGSGYRHLTAGDYRLNPEQPPLAKLVGAVPLLGLRLSVPESRRGDDEWTWSYAFVHERNDAGCLIAWARVPNVLLTLVLAGAIWAWGRSSLGASSGLVALALTVFHPSILGHGHLVTTDLPGALTMLAASAAFWRWSRSPSPWRGVVVGGAIGFATATRLTGWLLLPTFALLEALRLWRTPRDERRPAVLDSLRLALTVLALVPLAIWTAYGFRYAAWPGEPVARTPEPWLGLTGRGIAALESARILPEAYLEGARFVAEHNVVGSYTYLLGGKSTTGWPHYFTVAFLVKNTPGFLLATVGALGLLWRRRRDLLAGSVEAHWLVPAAVTFLAASSGRVQIGERYILPVYPYLILLAASAACWLLERRRGPWVLAAVLSLHVLPSLGAAPRGYLAYFNAIAGGTDGAHRVLVDSNLDWGQDLPRLAAWMGQHGVDRVLLGYHGSDNPDRFGIRHEDLPGLQLYPSQPAARPYRGTVAVSPNLLLGLFSPPGQNPYARLLERAPDDHAGVFLIYRVDDSRGGNY